MERDWEEHYRVGETPWDCGRAEPVFVDALARGGLPSGRALDLGCGTGANSWYLAHEAHYEVVGVDLSATAIAKARQSYSSPKLRFEVLDLLADPWPEGPFDLVLDRGCFHLFSDSATRRRIAEQVAASLRPGGVWLSLMGSTEGPARDHGPPRRTASEMVADVEPFLELVRLEDSTFSDSQGKPRAWLGCFRRRRLPPQPSTP